jgi:hypothetical protein
LLQVLAESRLGPGGGVLVEYTLAGGGINQLGNFLKARLRLILVFCFDRLAKTANTTSNVTADSLVPKAPLLGLPMPLCCGSFNYQRSCSFLVFGSKAESYQICSFVSMAYAYTKDC